MMLFLAHLRLPAPVLYFLAWLYSAIEGVVAHSGLLHSVYWLRSGIIQGCGLSGTLYALSTAPFLVDLGYSLEDAGLGLARACADDIGAVLFEARGLQVLFRAMRTTRLPTVLCLKVSKCKVTPLHATFDPDLLASTRELLCRLVPDWR
eukprot:9030784-Pyramimonas_sp.AAC.1